jgi:type VI secretion system protein VasD
LSPETRFIAVFAAYRDVERATWRASVAVQPGRKQTLVLRADSLALSLAIQP